MTTGLSQGFQRFLTQALVTLACASSSLAWATNASQPNAAAGNNEDTFVFAGICANGQTYRLMSYQKKIGGLQLSYYDYDGPAGKSTVQSETPPKVMAVRICRPSAEIISASYWE